MECWASLIERMAVFTECRSLFIEHRDSFTERRALFIEHRALLLYNARERL